jgi:hypothetical protein
VAASAVPAKPIMRILVLNMECLPFVEGTLRAPSDQENGGVMKVHPGAAKKFH